MLFKFFRLLSLPLSAVRKHFVTLAYRLATCSVDPSDPNLTLWRKDPRNPIRVENAHGILHPPLVRGRFFLSYSSLIF
eukprot:SAG31_NODE_49_length_30599_cov_15.615016_12_plen_78_part_00